MKLSKGFTLIELLVVIALIGVLAAGVIVTINPLAKINSANLAKVKTFSKSVENSISAAQVGKWSFEDSASPGKDSSGYNGIASLLGGVSQATESNCVFGKCLSFDGTNDYVEVPAASQLNSDSFSVAFWVNFSQIRTQGLLGKWAGPNAVCSWRMFAYNKIEFDACGEFANIKTGILQANRWYFVVGTYNNITEDVKLYMDGSLASSASSIGSMLNNISGSFKIGGQSTNYLNGFIDEVQVYSQALSASNIHQLYAQGLLKHFIAYVK